MIAVQTVNRLVVAGSLSAGGDRAGGPRGWRRRRRAARERARKKASGRRARGSAARLSRGRRPPGARRNRPPAAAPAPHPSPPGTFFQFATGGSSDLAQRRRLLHALSRRRRLVQSIAPQRPARRTPTGLVTLPVIVFPGTLVVQFTTKIRLARLLRPKENVL